MTAPAPAPQTHQPHDARQLTRWSLLMLPVYLVWALGLAMVGSMILMPMLDLSEGDLLLMAGGVAGWAAEILMGLAMAAPVIVGVVLAVKGLRRGGSWVAWVALGLNALLVAQAVFSFLDAIHMTYFPQGGWLFW